MGDDAAQRPPSDGSPPPNEDQADGATGPVGPPESSSERSDPAPFWNITKASFAVQVVVGVFTVIGVAAGIVIPLALSGGSSAKDTGGSSNPISTNGSTQSSGGDAPAPLISSDASCADFTTTAARSYGRRVLVDSPGEIEGGANDVRSRVLPGEEFSAVSRVVAGDEVEIKSLLHNGNYTAADGVSVSASISTYQGKCWRVMERVHVQSFPGDTPRLGPALILLAHGRQARLEYLPSSTLLMDEQGNPLTTDLADGVTQGGIRLPYAVPGGTAYFLGFRVRIRAL